MFDTITGVVDPVAGSSYNVFGSKVATVSVAPDNACDDPAGVVREHRIRIRIVRCDRERHQIPPWLQRHCHRGTGAAYGDAENTNTFFSQYLRIEVQLRGHQHVDFGVWNDGEIILFINFDQIHRQI